MAEPLTAVLSVNFWDWLEPPDPVEATVRVSSQGVSLNSAVDGAVLPPVDETFSTTAGTFAVELPRNNDPDWLPNGGWAYLVTAVFADWAKMAWLVPLDDDKSLAEAVQIPYPGAELVRYVPVETGGGGGGGGEVPASRIISAGAGLTGGGDLSADRILAANFGTGLGNTAQGNDSRFTEARGYFPLSGYGLVALAAAPEVFIQNAAMNNGDAYYARLWVPAGVVITGVAFFLSTSTVGFSSSAYVPARVYDDTGAAIGSAAADASPWTAPGWRQFPLTAPIAAQAVGRFVYAGAFIANITSGGATSRMVNTESTYCPVHFGLGPNRRTILYFGESGILASLDPTAPGDAAGFVAPIGLY